MLNNLSQFKLALLFAILIGFVSCQGGKKSGGQEQASTDSLNKEEIAQNVKEVVYPLPTPFEMTKMLNEIGAKFAGNTLNPASKAEKYFNEKSKALNLGVYAADIAYCATYDKKQETQNYLKALKTLVDALGISIDYSKMLTEEFKEKMNNKDTLSKTITNTIFETYQFLNDKNNPDLAVMMVSGMWIELMYIATHISKDTYDNPEMVKIIAKQKDSLTKLLDLLAKRNSNADIKALENDLLILKPVYDKVDKGLYKEDYQLILKTIEKIRNSLVS